MERIWRTIKKSRYEVALIALMVILMGYFWIPTSEALADETANLGNFETGVALRVQALQNKFTPYGQLPEAELADPIYQKNIYITAYNSVWWQTDATPCIGAQGTNICDIYQTGENVCAANFVPLGTMLEVEGLGVCTVRDRMNSRYYYRVDWFMDKDVTNAKQFGVQRRTVQVYNS
ncbi:3D domain-containing protein [Patescibacteria group bacterium]|nr:3D domain-containing protein [Patescibacteria group bacterium]